MKVISASVFLLLLLYGMALRAQTLTNSCSDFLISPGAVFYVNGDFVNLSSGSFSNAGETTVNGNLENQGSLNTSGWLKIAGDFNHSGSSSHFAGKVELYGGNQSVNCLSQLGFEWLILSGSSVKTMNSDIYITAFLDLTDCEINLNSHSAVIQSPNTNAINRTSGFVSTGQNGRLYRYTSSTGDYLFPLGSSSGTVRYRPVVIKPPIPANTSYFAAFVNSSPGTSSMPVSANDGSFCNLNDTWYHIAGNPAANTSGITVFYDPATDGNYNTLASWITNQWTSVSPVTQLPGSPLNGLFLSQWNPQTQQHIVPANPSQSLSLPSTASFCAGSSVTVSAGSGYSSYLWSNGAATESVTFTAAGMYYVTVSSGPCNVTDSILISEIPAPAAFAGNDTTVCQGAAITISASGGSAYLWSNGSTQQTQSFIPSATTTFSVTVTNNGCSDTDSVTVNVSVPPVVFAGNDTTIYQGQSVTLVPTFTGSITSYIWSPAAYLSNHTIPSPVAAPPASTTYTLLVTDGNGCSSSDAVTITVTEDPNADIIIYNTFTPNTDGVNDTWYIENIDHFSDNYLQIFNRNGHLVYEKQGYNNEWDGKYYGNELPAATYYYVLDLKDGRILKGDVTIIR